MGFIIINFIQIFISDYTNQNPLIISYLNTNQQQPQEHMLSSQLVYEFLPKKIMEWTPSDVELWFRKNNISLKATFSFQKQIFNGEKLMNISPRYLQEVCGVGSRVLSKKIVEWIENESQQFQEYLKEKNEQTRIDNDKSEIQIQITERREQQSMKEIDNNKQNKTIQQSNAIYDNQSVRHIEGIRPYDMVEEIKVQKWKKRKPLFNNEDILITGKSEHQEIISKSKSRQQQKSPVLIPRGAHFIRSAYEQCIYSIQFLYKTQSFLMQQSGTIGRLKENNIIILEESVSRKHAEIIKHSNRFYIKDLGSKFGTYFLLTNNVQLIINDILIINDTKFQISHLKLNKKDNTFSLSIKNLQDEPMVSHFQAKTMVYVYKNDNTVNFSDKWRGKYIVRVLVEDGKVYLCLEQSSTVYRRLKEHELYEISESQMIIKLGQDAIVQSKLIRSYKPLLNVTPFYDLEQSTQK